MSQTNRRAGAAGILTVILAAFVQFSSTFPQFQLPPVQSAVMAQAGLTQSQYVQCFTAPMLPAVLLGLCSGLLVDKYGPRKVVGAGILLTAAACFARCFCRSFLPFFLAMALTGVTPTLIHANNAKIMSRWFPADRVSTAVGAVMMGASCSGLIATSTTGLFPSLEAAYLFSGAMCAAALILWLLLIKDEGPYSSAGGHTSAKALPVRAILGIVVKCRTIWLCSFVMLFIMGFYMTVSSSAPAALQSAGYAPAEASLLASLLAVGAPAGCFLGSSLAIRLGKPKRFMLLLMAVTIAAFPLAWASASPALAGGAMILAGFCYGTCQVVCMSVPASLPQIGQEYAGTAGGLLTTVQMIGSIVIPSRILVPLAGSSYRALFLLAAGTLALALLAGLFLPQLNFRRQ